MATLFDLEVPTINEHLKNIYDSGELDRKRRENGTFLGEDCCKRLLEEIREIRLSELGQVKRLRDGTTLRRWSLSRDYS